MKTFIHFLFFKAAFFLFFEMFFATKLFSYKVLHLVQNHLIKNNHAEKLILFATDWRHGMQGDWPLYMPGFFVVGFLFFLTPLNTKYQKHILCISFLTSLAASYWTADFFSLLFNNHYSLLPAQIFLNTHAKLSILDLAQASLTLFCTFIFIISIRSSITYLKPLHLAYSLPFFVLLKLIRAEDSGSLLVAWKSNLAIGDLTAFHSLAFFILSFISLIIFQFSKRKSYVCAHFKN